MGSISQREEVRQNCVRWGKKSSFMCKMTASPVTGVLEPSVCRLSIRKELKGGKAFIKLGFVDLNLAEFAGAGSTARCCLLEGYDTKNTRQDNSILKVSISMQLLLGDPCFKTPPSSANPSTVVGSEGSLEADCKGDAGKERETLRRPNSLRLPKCRSLIMGSGICEDLDSAGTPPEETVYGRRTRSSTSSFGSLLSKGSGYSSEHSRCVCLSEPTRRRKFSSSSSGLSSGPSSAAEMEAGPREMVFEKPPRPARPPERLLRRKNQALESYPSWISDTRVNADDIVEKIVQTQDFTDTSNSEDSGLQLFVGRDGSTLFGGVQLGNRHSVSDYMPVVIGGR
ncbi:protein FAM102A-like isoform X2 [Pristis pectinata]|uniref:protein FAM102A-like isoform X2 n=1 Tax=Pristis pectinata TaxID=685728 RepID=UPI00223DC0AB|nr:protein FAM102A-like isoform X2 [Pristis pectinata]XP_051899869.1 protein FAM102A-like isoform X2 [Pristis pectinata]